MRARSSSRDRDRVTAYPFSAVVGMDDLKLALLVNAVSPAVGGVLLRGEKGTAKSTVVRGLAALLPPVRVVAGCRFSCDPAAPDPSCPDGPHPVDGPAESRAARLVELPVGASEDRVVGSLDLERALGQGVKAYEPGLLAAAHRGVLYVDEVNLLHDHLVDLLLDAAALGTSYVEREGVSVKHAARFLLVGTMNPEEGELRPQLLDRFGLTVEVAASRDPAERADVVRRRLAYEDDPEGFAAAWSDEDAQLAARIAAARELLPSVVLSDAALRQVTSICAAFEVDGLRADLVTARAAVALAAWAGRDRVIAEDVRQAAKLALPHRRRRNPFDAPDLDDQQLEQAMQDAGLDDEADEGEGPDDGGPDDGGPDGGGPHGGGSGGAPEPDPSDSGSSDAAADRPDGGQPQPQAGLGQAPAPPPAPQTVGASDPYKVRALTAKQVGADAPAGRRGRNTGAGGRTVGARRPEARLGALHLSATVTAAAPHQVARGRGGPGLELRRGDFREAVREGRESNLVLFVVDASGSMAARSRMSAVKGAVLSLLLDAYQRRDKVGLISFAGSDAVVLLPPTSSVEVGAARLQKLPTGGRTPLAAGLLRAASVLRVEKLRDSTRRPLLVLLTDGRATSGADPYNDALRAAVRLAGTSAVVVDCESGPVRLGLATGIAQAMGAELLRLEQLGSDPLAGVVRDRRAA
jgi:magnesium chelatase subunit D